MQNAEAIRCYNGGVSAEAEKKGGREGGRDGMDNLSAPAETEAEGTMKLIFCRACEDIIRLTRETRRCECARAGGYYGDNGVDATYWGTAVPLGFKNSDFQRAMLDQPERGMGERFEAFVIPKDCPTMRQLYER